MEQRRYGRDPSVVVPAADATFYAPLRWQEPGLVFTCSWSDWFHEDADPWRDDAWDVLRRTPHLTYQILTIEGLFGNLTGIRGNYKKVSRKWLQGYLNEFVWRYNHRATVDRRAMFEQLLLRAARTE